MRFVPLIWGTALLVMAGCAEDKPAYPAGTFAPGATPTATASSNSVTNRNLIVTLDPSSSGKVAKVNPSDRFVVLNFPLGHVPPVQQRLSLYRRGLKIGEVKVTGPQQDDNTVADLVTGEAEVGDEVRAQ
jgi:hypothetical protein